MFGLFALSDSFDMMLLEEPQTDIGRKIKDILWKGIVNPLRRYLVINPSVGGGLQKLICMCVCLHIFFKYYNGFFAYLQIWFLCAALPAKLFCFGERSIKVFFGSYPFSKVLSHASSLCM